VRKKGGRNDLRLAKKVRDFNTGKKLASAVCQRGFGWGGLKAMSQGFGVWHRKFAQNAVFVLRVGRSLAG